LPILVAILPVLIDRFLGDEYSLPYYKILMLLWLIVLAVPIAILIKGYSLRRPGAGSVAIVLGVLTILLGVAIWFGKLDWLNWYENTIENTHSGIAVFSFQMFDLIYGLLRFSWALFYAIYVILVIYGIILYGLSWKKDNKEKVRRTRHAIWTGTVSLFISSSFFCAVTAILWAVLAAVGSSLLPSDFKYYPSPWLKWFSTNREIECVVGGNEISDGCLNTSDFFSGLIYNPVFSLALVLIAIILVIAAWSFSPSILAEIFPPEESKSQKPRYGQWLTNGYGVVYCLLGLFCLSFAIFTLFYFLDLIFEFDFAGFNILGSQIPRLVSLAIATFITTSAIGLIALPGKLNQLTFGARNILDPILDVDNYFRLHPKGDNPRSRIYSRYASLLAHLSQKEYEAIIIVAHSQGTVITADLLRFLEQDSKSENSSKLVRGGIFDNLKRPPIYFFSMGCPLKQLYGLAFPHLYDWVVNHDDNIQLRKPDPKLLGLEQWLNTFRSGDYIGRHLWRSDNNSEELYSQGPSSYSKWSEFCLGAGAHTHYWDQTAQQVAKQLKELLAKAFPKNPNSPGN
jgi:hypothetical protein